MKSPRTREERKRREGGKREGKEGRRTKGENKVWLVEKKKRVKRGLVGLGGRKIWCEFEEKRRERWKGLGSVWLVWFGLGQPFRCPSWRA